MNTHLVVNSPPPDQGSVLGRIVAESRLGQLLRLISLQIIALKRSHVEIAALRSHREKLFSFKVGNDIERSSGKSALELCWETLQRVQYLNRRIALHQGARERIEHSGKFHYFLIRVAGIAGGPVAASKAMDPRYDRRVRDYKAEAACPNYLVETIKLTKEEEELCDRAENRTLVKTSEVNWFQDVVTVEVGTSAKDSQDNVIKKKILRVVPLRENLGREVKAPAATNVACEYKDKLFKAKLQRIEPRFHHVTPEDVEREESRTAFPRSRVSMVSRLAYEKKLADHVAEWRKKDYAEQEEARQFQCSAKQYWFFCFTFEFPKVCDKDAMEKFAEYLIKTVPREHLERLVTLRKGKRHYVRH